MATLRRAAARSGKIVAPRTLRSLAAAVQSCTNCDLYKLATQAVAGRGAAASRLLLVGEQPGDREDLAGEPFVGPAGAVLTRALAAAGIAAADVYLTNAVKHFKFEPRGKRRIHKSPRWSEVRACQPWLDAELRLVDPVVVVALGATAGKALLGPSFRLGATRGQPETTAAGRTVVATYHPSAVLRATDADRERLFAALVEDLMLARRQLRGRASG